MIFDQPPAELPVATVVPRDAGTQLAADLRAWLAARLRWLRPRAVPAAIAIAGLFAVLGAASYLRDYGRAEAERLTAAAGALTIQVTPNTTMLVDGMPRPDLVLEPVGPSRSGFRIDAR